MALGLAYLGTYLPTYLPISEHLRIIIGAVMNTIKGSIVDIYHLPTHS
jgi:hypothetical protein